MARKQPKLPRGTLFAGLLIVGFVLLLLDQNITKGLNFLFLKLFNPILSMGRSTTLEFSTLTPPSADFVTRDEYNKLLAEYDNVWAVLRAEHERYEKLARIRTGLPRPGPKLVLAEVRDVSVSGLKQELVINKGQADKLKVGQYILGKNSIIGMINETSETWSRIRLLTDVGASIEVGIWNEKKKEYIRGQMVGNGRDSGEIPLISRAHKINVGDTVYAAARAGLLETSVVIGKVTKINPDEKRPLLWDITVKPIQDAQRLSYVAVVVAEP
jgi:rod shape-determining protein MreC